MVILHTESYKMAFHFFVFTIKTTNVLINKVIHYPSRKKKKKKKTIAKYKILLGTSQDIDKF